MPSGVCCSRSKTRYRRGRRIGTTRRARCPETSDRAPASQNRLFLCQRFHPGPPATRPAPGCAIRKGLSCRRREQSLDRSAMWRPPGPDRRRGGSRSGTETRQRLTKSAVRHPQKPWAHPCPEGYLVGSHYAMAISLDREKLSRPPNHSQTASLDSAAEADEKNGRCGAFGG